MTVLEKVCNKPCDAICPLTAPLQPLDLACVETQIGDGSPMDCEIVELACTIHLKAQ